MFNLTEGVFSMDGDISPQDDIPFKKNIQLLLC